MAKIKIEMPDNTIFTTTIRVRITDINYGNHLGNDAVAGLLHEARMSWLHSHGFTELDIDGTGLIMADLAIEFRAEGFYGDAVTVRLAADNVSKAGFELYYSLTAARKEGDVLLALAKTGMICFDYKTRKIAPMPQGLLALL